jgi:hypothetical protein
MTAQSKTSLHAPRNDKLLAAGEIVGRLLDEDAARKLGHKIRRALIKAPESVPGIVVAALRPLGMSDADIETVATGFMAVVLSNVARADLWQFAEGAMIGRYRRERATVA